MSDTKRDDGGPVYPTPYSPDEDIDPNHAGMTLRDYFAAHSGLASVKSFEQGESSIAIDAIRAYRWADAMLKERAR